MDCAIAPHGGGPPRRVRRTTRRKQRDDSTVKAVSRCAPGGAGRQVFIDMRQRQAETPYLFLISGLYRGITRVTSGESQYPY
jgi:hypothetical protein